MKNVTVGQIVAGRNAEVVLKVADWDRADLFKVAIDHAVTGKVVGLVARNPVNKKDHIAEVEALVAEFNEVLAKAVESKSKEVVPVQENKPLKEQFKSREEWANRPELAMSLSHGGGDDHSKYAKNKAYAVVADNLEMVRERALIARPSLDIKVHQIMPFTAPDRQNRIGYIIAQVPAGLLQVKQWNGQEFVWLPMEEYNYDAFNSSRARLMFGNEYGSGLLKLAIKENEEGVFVSWPKSKGRGDVFYDVFKTADVRYGIFHSDNNYNVQAALTAFVQVFWGEFKQANPRNRHGFNEHCGNCRHMLYLPIHDQMGVDYENKANPVDTSELGQWGSHIPQWICTVHKDFTDKDAIDDLNDATSFENRSYIDEEGNVRFLRVGEVLIKGKPVHTYNVRAEGTEDRCARCPFYAKNERKPEQTLTREKEAANGGYVPAYWTDRARAERMPIFTQHKDRGELHWDLGFPGEFGNPVQFAVQGIGGINVYGTDELMQKMPKQFVATTEAYRADEAQVGKLINIIHSVCNRFTDITPETLDALVKMIKDTPAPVKQPLLSRYERAMARLATVIQENQ